MRPHTFLLLVILLAFSCSPKKQVVNMSKAEKILSKEIEGNRSPSVQYYLFNQDSILKSFCAGFADIDEQRKVDISTTYNALSVTKTFTALAILQLYEQGKIDINRPVKDYLPDFVYGNEITVKQLMTHSAGLPNPVPLNWIHLAGEHHTFDRNEFFDSIIEKNQQVKSGPNDKYAYSNIGYVVLGQLIEQISGDTYENYITGHIIHKLPVCDHDLSFTVPDKEKHATGYHKRMTFSNVLLGLMMDKSKFTAQRKGKWLSFKSFYVNGASYGGLIGNPDAFIQYIRALLKDNSRLISNEYKQLLFQENKNSSGKNTGMCLSWFAGELNGQQYFAHAGGGGGYYCEIRIYPGLKMGSVVFFNRTGMADERYLDKLDGHYIDH